jgi:hypothetical protein
MLRYIKIINGEPINYTIEQLLQEYPDAQIFGESSLPNESLLKQYDVYPLITTPKPQGDVVEEGEPIFNGREWIQSWKVESYTNEENNISPTDVVKPQDITNFPDNSQPNFFTPFLENKELFVDNEIREYRYDICKSCDKFINLTKQCKECGCFMTLKTKLKIASCPLNKWQSDADK